MWKNRLPRLREDSELINPWKWIKQLSHLFRSSLEYQEVGGSWTNDIKGGSGSIFKPLSFLLGFRFHINISLNAYIYVPKLTFEKLPKLGF